MSSSWFSAFYNNHNKLKVPNHRFQCRKIKCALSIKVIYVDSKFTCGIFKRLSYGKDLLHSKWMLVHSYECRVIPSVNTIGNNQPTLLMPLKSWRCYGLIKCFHLSLGFHKYCFKNLDQHQYEEYEVHSFNAWSRLLF